MHIRNLSKKKLSTNGQGAFIKTLPVIKNWGICSAESPANRKYNRKGQRLIPSNANTHTHLWVNHLVKPPQKPAWIKIPIWDISIIQGLLKHAKKGLKYIFCSLRVKTKRFLKNSAILKNWWKHECTFHGVILKSNIMLWVNIGKGSKQQSLWTESWLAVLKAPFKY